MSQKLTIQCFEPVQAHKAMTAQIWPQLKAMVTSGHRMVLELRPQARSTQENRLLHALIGEIARQKEWGGKKHDTEVWKRLLVSAWCRARGDQITILPAIDGQGVDIVPVRTSKLSVAECAELITFVQAWAAMNGVATVDPDSGEIF